jgi:hypothetical protein
LKKLTRPGGVHAHIVFTDVVIYEEKGEEIDYFAPGELGAIYSDWFVLQHDESAIPCAQDGIGHCHSVERIVTCARRDEAGRVGDDPPPRVA